MLLIICNVIRHGNREYKRSGAHPLPRQKRRGWSKSLPGWESRPGWECRMMEGRVIGWRRWTPAGNGKRRDKGTVGGTVLQQQGSTREAQLQQSPHKREASRTEGRTWNCPLLSWITRASSEQEEIPGLLCWEKQSPPITSEIPFSVFCTPTYSCIQWWRRKKKVQMNALTFTWAREIFLYVKEILSC